MTQEITERHASWLELFFDLVVVAAILQLAARLHDDPGLNDVFVFIALYLAVWIAWTAFTLYANVAGDRTQRRAMLLAMFGIAVMAAAIPEATGDRAQVFAGAYCIVRVLGLRTWGATRKVLTAWPTVQAGFGIGPWIASIWYEPPARYWLWGAGLAIDVLLPFLMRGGTEAPEFVRRMVEQDKRRRATHPNKRFGPESQLPEISVARLDLPHLAERLGLFIIIVLGEGVTQLVVSAGRQPVWTREIILIGIAGFLILVGIWWPTFKYGLDSTHQGTLPVQVAMPFHFLTVLSITGIAAGLGALMAHTDHATAPVRWLLCGGFAVYFLSASIGGLIIGQPWYWLVFWGLPSAAVPVLLAIFGEHLSGAWLAWLLVAVVAWQALFVWQRERKERGGNAIVSAG